MNFDLKDAIARSDKVEGWLRGQEKEFLYQTALETAGNGVVVEIGSWKGKSTTLMGCAIKARGAGHIYAVDPFGKPEKMVVLPDYDLWTQQGQGEHFTAFMDNITEQGVADVITPIKAMSEDAVEIYKRDIGKPIQFLFIDGCHQREFVQKDFDLWSPLVAVGGIIGFHDAWDNNRDFDDSAAIVAKIEVKDSSQFKDGQVQSLVWGKKLHD